jgi:hypothetical protein
MRELDVREQAMGRGRVDGGRVEDPAVRLVLIEPEVQELALVHPGRGGAGRVGRRMPTFVELSARRILPPASSCV